MLCSSLAICVAALAACGERVETAPDPEPEHLGQARLALELPLGSAIQRIRYELTFSFLEGNPPVVYNVETYESVLRGGELIAILPCWTTASGTGLNQVDIAADVYFEGLSEPVKGYASTIFECVRNADTLVNIVINIVRGLDAGFVDLDIAATGTLCASKVDMKDDAYLGVCPESTCGQSAELFVFANTCYTVHGAAPTFWVCGDPTDWVIQPTFANALFPVPDQDGAWRFGLVALDPLRMAQADPSLTDEQHFLKVWAGVSASFAEVERLGGVITRTEIARRVLDFVTELQVPSQAPGHPAPKLLLVVDAAADGARVSQLGRFSPCEVPVATGTSYEGYEVADVRLAGPGRARLLLRALGAAHISSQAYCEAGWVDGAPAISCGELLPLGGG